jgi:hemolysin activation/secretion protein
MEFSNDIDVRVASRRTHARLGAAIDIDGCVGLGDAINARKAVGRDSRARRGESDGSDVKVSARADIALLTAGVSFTAGERYRIATNGKKNLASCAR